MRVESDTRDLRGEGTVLVVDDEAAVRNTAQAALQRQGYSVLRAENGRVAVDLLAAHPEIRVVVLDLTMPVMGGEEALRNIHRLRPELPVILSSGFNETESISRFADRLTSYRR